MKKFIFTLILFGITQAFGEVPTRADVILRRDVLGEESDLSRDADRYKIKLTDRQEQYLEFRALADAYPLAAARLGRVESFSYFGFLLHEVREGRHGMEDFLKEYEAYLSSQP